MLLSLSLVFDSKSEVHCSYIFFPKGKISKQSQKNVSPYYKLFCYYCTLFRSQMIKVLPASTSEVFAELEKLEDDGIKGLYSRLLLFCDDDFMVFELQC